MGTLFDQPPRQDRMRSYVATVGSTLDQMYPDVEDVTPEMWTAAAAVTQAALSVQSADTMDEQLAGFGEILQRLPDAISDVARAIESLQ